MRREGCEGGPELGVSVYLAIACLVQERLFREDS